MKKILGLILYAGLMFGVTAGLGMFMMKTAGPHGKVHVDGEDEHGASEHAAAEHDADHAAESASGAHDQTVDAAAAHGDEHSASADSHPPAASHHDDHLPVAARSSPMSVEEIVRMGIVRAPSQRHR